jgi:hypothetical protein
VALALLLGVFELAILLGDINADGILDIRDYGLWRQHFGETSPGPLRPAPRQRPSRLFSG